MINYLGYVRKSSETSERQILSITDQENGIQDKFSDLNIIETITESKSAFKPYNRHRFDDTLKRIERGEAQGLIAWHPNRLSRNEIDAARIVYLVRVGLIKDLKFVTYTFENTPEGIWMLQTQLSQSQYESAKLGREVTRGINTKLKLGHYPHKAPPGYLNSGPATTKGARFIQADAKRLPLVERALRMALTGNFNTAEVYRTMRNWGFTTVILGKKPSPVTYAQVHRMLRNVFYTGYFEHNREIYKGDYPAILSRPEFEQLQLIMNGQSTDKLRRLVHRNYVPYSGLMRCGACNLGITATEKRKYYAGTDRHARYIYYHCPHNGARHGKCPEPPVSEAQLDATFKEEVSKYRILGEFRDYAIEWLDARYSALAKEADSVRDSRRRELADMKLKTQSLIDMRANGEIDVEDFKDRKDFYQKCTLTLQRQVDEGGVLGPAAHAAAKNAFDDLASIRKIFNDASTQTRRQILMSLSESNLILKDRKLHLQAKRWYAKIRDDYRTIEAGYLANRTSNFASTKSRTADLATIISNWCSTVDTVADLIEDQVREGLAVGRLLPESSEHADARDPRP